MSRAIARSAAPVVVTGNIKGDGLQIGEPWTRDAGRAEAAEGPLRRAWAWLVRPAPVRVSPLAVGLVTAGLALVLLLPGRGAPPAGAGPDPVAGGPADGAVVYVQFVLEAPGATTVAVAGDFSDWEPSFMLDDPDGDGIWTGRVPVRPGVHTYMFLVDEAQWRTDPNADRYRDDGFGNRNAVLAVTAGA